MSSQGEAAVAEKTVHILLLEDEDAHAELIQRAFQIWERPVRLTLAHSLREAHDRLAEFVPDLIIADLLLPDGRGVEVVPPRDDRSCPAYPVVVMTSHGDEKSAVEAMKGGALDYVVKSKETLADIPHIAERALREWGQIIARKRAEEELKTRTQQLLALSHLGQRVLSGVEIPALMNEAVDLIGQTLDLPHVTLLERCTDTRALLLWAAIEPEALFSRPTVVGPQTLNGLTLASSEPVVVDDLRQDPRFLKDSLSQEQSLVSGVSVAVGGPEEPLGVLWAFADKRRRFTEDDIHFLRSTANVLAVAIERQRSEARTHKLQNELLRVSRVSAMGEFGTAVAHELNQPITAAMNYVQACRRLLVASGGCVSEEILELMGEAVGEAERAGAILRHLRRFVEKGELQRTGQDLNKVVHDAARLALAEAAEENIHVSFELADNLPRVFIDKIQVQQVVFNLVRNAREALEGSSTREITIGTLRCGDAAVEVLVQDTGPGADPNIINQLFTEYFSTKENGMGVGLSISQSLVDAHGGRLWVTATPGGGAIFHFTLPVIGLDHGE